MKVINNAMCCWRNTLVMDKYESENLDEMEEKDFHHAQYETNSVLTMEKMLWTVFRYKVSN